MPAKKRPMICKQCKSEYQGISGRKYCGYICAKKAREKKKEAICLNCNKTFLVWVHQNPKYCSKKCNHIHKSSPLISVVCKHCDKNFLRKQHKLSVSMFCTKKCADKHNAGKNHYEWKPFKHLANTKDSLRRWAILVKERDGYRCTLCGTDRISVLEAHHIKEKNFHPDLQFDINNGTTLCLKCHYLQHLNSPKAARLIMCNIKKHYPDEFV